MKQEFITMMRDIGEGIRENFEDTTRTWHHQPKFEPDTSVPTVGADKITVESSTRDRIYAYVSEGTKSHPIFPRNAKALAFPGAFIPKTFPGVIGASTGFSGEVNQFRNWIAHPGVEARKFDDEIARSQENKLKNYTEKTSSLVSKASGHQYP